MFDQFLYTHNKQPIWYCRPIKHFSIVF